MYLNGLSLPKSDLSKIVSDKSKQNPTSLYLCRFRFRPLSGAVAGSAPVRRAGRAAAPARGALPQAIARDPSGSAPVRDSGGKRTSHLVTATKLCLVT